MKAFPSIPVLRSALVALVALTPLCVGRGGGPATPSSVAVAPPSADELPLHREVVRFPRLASAARPARVIPPTAAGGPGQLAPRITTIMHASPYRHGAWGLLEVDPTTGRVIHALSPDRFFMPGSTAKVFSVSAALDALGFAHRFTTPVYAHGAVVDGTLTGSLVLVAQGDLTMGGRTKPDGSVDFTNNLDHGDANALPGATLTPENPLAGLNQIARQVRASGITAIHGDVVIDDRLFQPDPNFLPTPDPIIINDNLIDVVITPGRPGQPPTSVTWRPQVAPYHLEAQVTTVAAGQPTTVQVQTFPDGRVLVSGQIAADAGPVLRTGPVVDPAAFARTALIEALGRAGVSVSAPPTGPNPAGLLPAQRSYQGDHRVAAYVSPPFREYAKLILKVSHNLGANLVVCLMAVKAGSTDCGDGFAVMRSFFARAHVDRNQLMLADGDGGNPVNRVTPRAAVALLRYWLARPEGAAFRHLLPALGVDGTLASVARTSPAKGRVFAKTGTLVAYDPLNARLSVVKALAGYLEVRPGRVDVFDLVVNDAAVPGITEYAKLNDDLGAIAALLQQEAARGRGHM